MAMACLKKITLVLETTLKILWVKRYKTRIALKRSVHGQQHFTDRKWYKIQAD